MEIKEKLAGLTPSVQADVRRWMETFGVGEEQLTFEEEKMAGWQQDQDEVVVTEPIVAKQDCRLEIVSAESAEWTVKEHVPEYAGQTFKAMKLTLQITDPNVQTEHEGARPRLTLEHQMNLDRYPYLEKKSGWVKWLGRTNLYELEEAFGFDPVFTNGNGEPVEPFITRTGRKVAPKGEGMKRSLNPAFTQAYFTTEGSPNLEWAGKSVWADIIVQEDERFGARNRIQRFKRAPVNV